ncbi:MAG TPA: hypothetical protein VF458_12235 [Ktedonobacteraceae bacterium]
MARTLRKKSAESREEQGDGKHRLYERTDASLPRVCPSRPLSISRAGPGQRPRDAQRDAHPVG